MFSTFFPARGLAILARGVSRGVLVYAARAPRLRSREKIDLAIAFDIPSLTVGVRYQPLTNPDGNGGDPRSGFFHSPWRRGLVSGIREKLENTRSKH